MPPLALLAGGLATRLGDRTMATPKALLPVAGEPFIAHQFRLLRREGIERVVICAAHLGGQIEAFAGDGSRWGLEVTWSFDGPVLLGTGGALRQALPLLGESFLVLYGDSYLDIPFRPVVDAYRRSGLPAMMTVLRNAGRWDTSNAVFCDGMVVRYDKEDRSPEMEHIDYGLGVLSAATIASRPEGVAFDLATVYRELAAAGALGGYEVFERFYEIGSETGLGETDAYLRAHAAGR
jgi:NDP-sugar pyrophosphorylase family protein